MAAPSLSQIRVSQMLVVAQTACGAMVVFSNEGAVMEAHICGDNGVTVVARSSKVVKLLPWLLQLRS